MLLIKGGNIIDGTGKPAYKADILISKDKISAIGAFPKKDGAEVIDALGMNVVPGFIDVNTNADHDLTIFTNPGQEKYLLQGVTTIIGGHCGSSLAPLLYGNLDSIRKWADPSQINVNWHSVKDFFVTLSVRKIGVNFGMLVGHSTIRRALIGEDMRDLTDNELSVFKNILTTALEEGALGLSTGLGYAHSNLVSYSEILALTKVVSKFGCVYSTHLRNEEKDLEKSIEETISITKQNKLNTLISHMRPLNGYEKNIDRARRMLNMLNKNINLNFDISLSKESVVSVYTLLPEWARRGSLEEMLSKIKNKTSFDQIKAGLSKLDLENMVVANVPFNQYLIGKNLRDYASEKQLGSADALLHFMLATSLRASIAISDTNLTLAKDMIFDERALISSTFTGYLELPNTSVGATLENKIRKITAIPAKKFGIKNRGFIQEGFFADIVLMHDNLISDVIVNGMMAVQNGEIKNSFSGRIIKK